MEWFHVNDSVLMNFQILITHHGNVFEANNSGLFEPFHSQSFSPDK